MSSRILLGAGLALFLGTSAFFAMDTKPSYPPSRTVEAVDDLHGTKVPDPYRWLEDNKDTAVQEWVEKQNALTRQVLDKLPGRKEIRDKLGALLDIGTIGTPAPRKGRYFYTKRVGAQNQPVLYVREGVAGKDAILVDPNEIDKEGTTAIDWWFPSRDGKLLAYGISKSGDEKSTLYVRDVLTGKNLPDTISRTRACSVAWLPDGSGFYYTRYPAEGSVAKGEENYHRHVFLHKLGDDPEKDAEVFGAGRAPTDWPSVTLSPDGRWLGVTESQGWAKSEIFVRDLKQPDSKFVPLVEKVEASFDITLRNDAFYVRTNHEAPRYRLFKIDPAKLERKDWNEIIKQGDDVLEGVAVIGDRLIAEFMKQAASKLRLFDRDGTPLSDVPLPTLGSLAGLGGEADGNELFFGFQSFTMPTTIYHLPFAAKEPVLWQKLDAAIDFEKYEVEQVKYPSKDGTPITMFLAQRKGLKKDGKNPTLLYGYGGFNISLTPTFSASRFLFLEAGGLLAIANLRGGGEYGEDWHKAGMLGNKQNVFDDYIAAAEWLIKNDYTSSERLAIQGGSNGGLLVGAALTQRPDLFRVVLCHVPLLDMVRYHKFLIAKLWIPEYGSADDPKQFKWLHDYSPYHRVKDGTKYPATMLLAAESDTRVDALHARKMAARLQAASGSDQPILLRLETKAGHGAGKPRAKVLDELVDVYSFLFWQLGMRV